MSKVARVESLSPFPLAACSRVGSLPCTHLHLVAETNHTWRVSREHARPCTHRTHLSRAPSLTNSQRRRRRGAPEYVRASWRARFGTAWSTMSHDMHSNGCVKKTVSPNGVVRSRAPELAYAAKSLHLKF